jgi:hypothetical protein
VKPAGFQSEQRESRRATAEERAVHLSHMAGRRPGAGADVVEAARADVLENVVVAADVGLHAMGREFGSTTGRARRCGWFDSVATRHAQMVNGIDELAVTNVDGLDTLDVVRVCIGYRVGSTKYDYVPNDIEAFQQCMPIYAEFPGWKTPTHKIREWKTAGELPQLS